MTKSNEITDVLEMLLPDMSKFPHPPVPKFLTDAMRKSKISHFPRFD